MKITSLLIILLTSFAILGMEKPNSQATNDDLHLFPIEHEEEEANKLRAYLQKHITQNWHSDTSWIAKPIALLVCSENREQARLLPRALAMEISNKFSFYDSYLYATPTSLSQLKTELNIMGTIKSMVTAVRKTIIIRDLLAFYKHTSKNPDAKDFTEYLYEIAKTRNVVCGFCIQDLHKLPNTIFEFFKPEVIISKLCYDMLLEGTSIQAFKFPVASTRELILSTFFEKLDAPNFAGFYGREKWTSNIYMTSDHTKEKIKADLRPFTDEHLRIVVKQLEPLIKTARAGYTYIGYDKYSTIMALLEHRANG